jgi:hypothetical protein
MGCNRYPRCRTIVSVKQKDQLLQLQAQGTWPPKTAEEADTILGRKKSESSKKQPIMAGKTSSKSKTS